MLIMFRKQLLILSISFLFLIGFTVIVNALGTDYQESCSANSVDPNCRPPNFYDVQLFVVQLIGTAWALGGFIFAALLIYNGTLYLMGYFEELKFILGASIEDAQKRMVQWGVGFVLFFISYPIVHSLLKLLIGPDSDCYSDLRVPGFTFIFYDVCTQPSTTVTPTP